MAQQLPRPIAAYLARFAVRRRGQRIVRAAGLTALFTLAWTLLCCFIDRLNALPAIVRASLLAVNVAVAVMLMARPLGATLRRWDWVKLAREVEMREARWGERLWTVTSRLLGPARLAGSQQLLGALTAQVAEEAQERDARRLLPWRAVARPWIVAMMMALVWASLWRIEVLDLPRLTQRYVTPLAPTAPAATTRLLVTPGHSDIAEGQTLRVRVTARRLGDSPVELHYRPRGQNWTRVPMVLVADATFEARVADVQRDVEYHVIGGDARSSTYRAAVLHKPAVAALRARCVYPAYTGLPSGEVEVRDGAIEAPVATEATLIIESTEPLSAATVMIGGEALPTAATDRPNMRTAPLPIRDDARFNIRMTSARGVEGVFRGGVIRAVADRPPVVLLTATQTDAAGVTFDATDDYGIARLYAEIAAGDERRTMALPLRGNRREQRGVVDVSAASLSLPAGERITVRVRAEDVGGQFAVSPPIQISATTSHAAPPPAPAPAATQPSLPLIPPGYLDELRAYFEAIRRTD